MKKQNVVVKMILGWVEKNAYKSAGAKCSREYHQPKAPAKLLKR